MKECCQLQKRRNKQLKTLKSIHNRQRRALSGFGSSYVLHRINQQYKCSWQESKACEFEVFLFITVKALELIMRLYKNYSLVLITL